MPNILKDITGQQFGTLTVLTRSGGKHEARWLCKCTCGTERVYVGGKLRRGDARCYCSGGRDEHGLTNDPLYIVWANMKWRCLNANSTSYHRYGGRGIKVHEEWKNNFLAFHGWAMSNGWSSGLEIDRIDNDGPYTPSNCHFVTPSANCRNKSSNFKIEFNGMTKLLVEWSETLGVPMKVLHNRIRTYGWTTDRALSTPHMSVKQAAMHRSVRSN